MQAAEVIERFRRTGALLEGHFILSSGLHSTKYLQCALLLQYPAEAMRFGQALAEHFRDQRIETVDFWHAGQHLHTAATALFGATAEATAWAEARKADLATVGPAPVLAAFDRAKPPSAQAAEIRRVEREYFAKRVDQLQYPTLRLDGLPIGSGPIESAADHVVQRRMKRAGMRWSLTGGQAMLALRARLRSHRTLAA